MPIKDQVLALLESKKGEAVSGEMLAESLGVSRTAIWKSVKDLRKNGYQIDAATRRGYVLADSSDILSLQGILPFLTEMPFAAERVQVFPTLDSTNAEAKRHIAVAPSRAEIPYDSILIAEQQTAGQGHRNRAYFSPSGSSIYMSFVLRPAESVTRTRLIPLVAAVAVCETIEVFFPEEVPGIKWVNDIFFEGKKISGIRTEAITDVESGDIETVILGIGLNINVPKRRLPDELKETTGSLPLRIGKRNEFAATLINRIRIHYQRLLDGNVEALIRDYRVRSFVVGKRIWVLDPKGNKAAVVTGIGEDGALLVTYDDNTQARLMSGEIQLAESNL
ncbi:MAG: biotin--[acetyl-CoA-carboxylase] ligase [Clostridiales Family XIII bacterium]|jgi:BirA family biotin operon repressor/biotin-[acetyl-CoA-carboxylase] ligase|nr:biotin--[acetyl-CoA-carboxylase] ligase [Clostridiales Family XIII bacterium]